MEILKLAFETDDKADIDKVKAMLATVGLKYKSAVRERLDVPSHAATKKKKCCGGGNKTVVVAETPKPTLKDRLMVWSYKHISKCLFCAGMRIGVFIGILLGIAASGIFIIYK